jgi:hypothetical protein
MKRRAFVGGLFAGAFSLIAAPSMAIPWRRSFGVIQRQKEPSIQGKRRWLLIGCRKGAIGASYKTPIYDDESPVYLLQQISREWFGYRETSLLTHQNLASAASGSIGFADGLIHWRIVPDGDPVLDSWKDAIVPVVPV